MTALETVRILDDWLDAKVADDYKDQPLAQDWARISKVAEELGEAVQAFIGATGQNPRKGFVNDIDDVLEEMADVIITGTLCIQHFTKNSEQTHQIIDSRWSYRLAKIGLANQHDSPGAL